MLFMAWPGPFATVRGYVCKTIIPQLNSLHFAKRSQSRIATLPQTDRQMDRLGSIHINEVAVSPASLSLGKAEQIT